MMESQKSQEDGLFSRYFREMTNDQCIDLVAESITTMVRFSTNESFRQDCFELLEVTNSTDLVPALKEHLIKCIDNIPKGRKSRKKNNPQPSQSQQEDQQNNQVDSLESEIQPPELAPELPQSSFTYFNDEGFSPMVFDILTPHSQSQNTPPSQTYLDVVPGTSKSCFQMSTGKKRRETLTDSQIDELSASVLGPGWAKEPSDYPEGDQRVAIDSVHEIHDPTLTPPAQEDSQESLASSTQVSESLLQNIDMEELMLQEVNDTNRASASKRQETSAAEENEQFEAAKRPRLDEDLL